MWIVLFHSKIIYCFNTVYFSICKKKICHRKTCGMLDLDPRLEKKIEYNNIIIIKKNLDIFL